MTGQTVTWSINPTTGVSINSSGVLTVTPSAPAGSFTVTARSSNKSGTCTVALSRAVSVATTIEVTGSSAITIPASGTATGTYTATVKDQYGSTMTGETVTWSIDPSTGVSIDASGVVTVTSSVSAGNYTVTATDGIAVGSCTVTLSKATSGANTITVSGPASIAIPKFGVETASYTATVYDQNGAVVSGKKVRWSLQSAGKGIDINRSTGVVTVVCIAKTGSFKVVAADGAISGSLTVTLSSSSVTSVSLNKSSTTIPKGSSETLVATVLPEDAANKRVVWCSSNNRVASVDSNGTVTGLKEGTAVITVMTLDGRFKASCTVKVTKGQVLVKSVKLIPNRLQLFVNNSQNLCTIALPLDATNKTLAWASSNESIATVDANGRVTAVREGKADITATATDGSGKTDTCTVTVKKVVPVTGVTLNKSELSLKVRDIYLLIAKIIPSDATKKNLTWKSSNLKIVTVSDTGFIKGLKEGTATITVTTEDGSYKASCTVTVVSNRR